MNHVVRVDEAIADSLNPRGFKCSDGFGVEDMAQVELSFHRSGVVFLAAAVVAAQSVGHAVGEVDLAFLELRKRLWIGLAKDSAESLFKLLVKVGMLNGLIHRGWDEIAAAFAIVCRGVKGRWMVRAHGLRRKQSKRSGRELTRRTEPAAPSTVDGAVRDPVLVFVADAFVALADGVVFGDVKRVSNKAPLDTWSCNVGMDVIVGLLEGIRDNLVVELTCGRDVLEYGGGTSVACGSQSLGLVVLGLRVSAPDETSGVDASDGQPESSDEGVGRLHGGCWMAGK
jgi:hypothetical protein